jgi:hypothetical protein
MNITGISVVTGLPGGDVVALTTDLPEACWPFTNKQVLRFETPPGTGEGYVRTYFPDIALRTIDARTGEESS